MMQDSRIREVIFADHSRNAEIYKLKGTHEEGTVGMKKNVFSTFLYIKGMGKYIPWHF